VAEGVTGRFISAEAAHLVALGPPVPKARPRLGANKRWYTPEKTVVYENHIAWICHQKGVRFGAHPVQLYVEFHMANDHLVDGDNLLKALLDGCVKGSLFDDDSQVLSFQCVVFYSSDNPRTEWTCRRLDVPPESLFDAEHATIQT